MANIPRAAALALFRVHIENGLSVAAGVGLTGLLAGLTLGLDAAAMAAAGALCVSISDQPDPLHLKPWILGWALVIAMGFTSLAAFAQVWGTPYATMAMVGFAGLFTGLISAYGKHALTLSMSGILALVYALGRHFQTPGEVFFYLDVFAAGALFYATCAGGVAVAFDDRARRLLMAEAMRSFATYLRAKAALYNPDMEGPSAFRALIDAHAALVERLQSARDAIFSRRSNALQKKRIDALIALLDAFEVMLSGDADFELLRRSRRRALKWQIHAFIRTAADEIENLTLTLRRRRSDVATSIRVEDAAALMAAVEQANHDTPESEAMNHAYYVTTSKLIVASDLVAALARALDRNTAPSALASELDLAPFQQNVPRGFGLLVRQFDLARPALRFGIRLSLAMMTGLALTLIFPRFAHANWVLLTIALVMRANYSVTSRRRLDRLAGTLIGCAAAVALIAILPPWLLLSAVMLAIGLSHAYAGVRYRVTAAAASISALVLLHFSDPSVRPQFFERVTDTMIGAALSYVFSFLLPSWERNDLPRLVKELLAADSAFAQAALRRVHLRQPYRLARKRILDAVAQLSGVIRRMADEPDVHPRALVTLNKLLGANYALASDLASMPVLMKVRGGELDPARADAQIAAARHRVVALLTGAASLTAPREGPARLKTNFAMTVLARRLAHIEHMAARVARLAARPLERITISRNR